MRHKRVTEESEPNHQSGTCSMKLLRAHALTPRSADIVHAWRSAYRTKSSAVLIAPSRTTSAATAGLHNDQRRAHSAILLRVNLTRCHAHAPALRDQRVASERLSRNSSAGRAIRDVRIKLKIKLKPDCDRYLTRLASPAVSSPY